MRRLTLVGRSVSFSSLVAASAVLALAGCGDNKSGGNPRSDGGICSGSFVSPADLSTLTETADTTMSCADGFQTNVTVAISEPDDTKIDLLVGGTKVATA